jgi:hypothetical protein
MGVDHLRVGLAIAQALGVKPADDRPPVRDDLSRFGVFIDQAARLGLSPEQTERVGRQINETPDRRLPDDTRTQLIEHVVKGGASRDAAEREVTRLEVTARLVPNTLTAHGLVSVPPATAAPSGSGDTAYAEAVKKQAALGGSGNVIGGAS